MLRTRFGTPVVSLKERRISDTGEIWIACVLVGCPDLREIHLADFRADGGYSEVNRAIESLPTVDERNRQSPNTEEG